MEVFPSIEDLRNWADQLEEVQVRIVRTLRVQSHVNGRWPISVDW